MTKTEMQRTFVVLWRRLSQGWLTMESQNYLLITVALGSLNRLNKRPKYEMFHMRGASWHAGI